MARRKSQTSATGANMDSLLDALTNVVGILVIVLVAVQLSSQEAARRMEEMIAQIDPAEQERIKQEAEDSKMKQPAKSYSTKRKMTVEGSMKLVETFLEIQRNIHDCMKHARFYSYYRVVHGVLSSTSFILTVFLIKIVSPIVDLKLYEGIVTKFRALFEISPTTKPEIMKWLFLSVTTFLVFYSLAMIVTALSRYVYHSKGQNMTIKGQISLGIYFFFHVVTWCTVWLALFSTAGLATNSVCFM